MSMEVDQGLASVLRSGNVKDEEMGGNNMEW